MEKVIEFYFFLFDIRTIPTHRRHTAASYEPGQERRIYFVAQGREEELFGAVTPVVFD